MDTHGQKLGRAQWLVLLAAFLGWLFDGFEIGLFPVIARPALADLLKVPASHESIGQWIGIITAAFLLGAAAGGLIFGWLGDRIGRVRAMSFSILTYSLFTGLGWFSSSPMQLAIFRFIASLGMGGEWALGVALVMECWPEKWRPWLAGAIGASSNVGILFVAWVAKVFPVTGNSWRRMFLIGACPALLVFLIRLFVPESEKWKAAVKHSVKSPVEEIFSPEFRRRTLLGIAFASIALIGTWGSVQWIPSWIDQLTDGKNPAAKAVSQMFSSYGAIIGSLLAPVVGGKIGRRPAYFGLCLGSLLVCGIMFGTMREFNGSLKAMIFLAGMFTAAFYGWFPLYLPELFPTRMRATGQGVSYNTGRVIAAGGALVSGQLVSYFADYARMGSIITLVYLLGMALIWLAPETKGKPLPD
jgi:MFS family permease